jgi:predicted dehydrogenase
VRIALAGLGSAAVRGHLPTLARLQAERRLRLVAAADSDATRRAAVAAELGGIPIFESVEAMLDEVRSDVLVIATEPSAHAVLAALGARHGQHVVCEKPIVLGRGQLGLVERAYGRQTALALVPVHQYRYARTWRSLSKCARIADRVGAPFVLNVEVDRVGVDPYAVSRWRADIAQSGGMLADVGTHFIALGWTISDDIEVLHAARLSSDGDADRAAVRLRVGSGVLDLQVSSAAGERRTRIDLRVSAVAFTWCDDRAEVKMRGRTMRSRYVGALTERSYVDALYLPLYRDLVRGLHESAWRARRTAEALGVSGVLVALLERLRD